MLAALIAEIVLTGMFLIVILGATSKAAPAGFAPLAIGLCLTVIHIIGIPIDNLSVNPARSIASAIFASGEPMRGASSGCSSSGRWSAARWAAAIWRYLLSPGESPAGIGQVK